MRIAHHGNDQPALAAMIEEIYDGQFENKGRPSTAWIDTALDHGLLELENYENPTFLY
jgi:hypothetical protein